MLEIKTKEINNAFSKFESSLDIVKEWIRELGHRSIKSSQTETQTDKNKTKKPQNIQELWMKHMHNCNNRKRRENEAEKGNFWQTPNHTFQKFREHQEREIPKQNKTHLNLSCSTAENQRQRENFERN